MSDYDWNKLGRNICDLIQDAIDTQDFDKLNSNISRTIQQALDGVSGIVREAGQAAEHAVDEAMRSTPGQCRKEERVRQQRSQPVPQRPVLFVNVGGSRIGGIALAIGGYMLTLMFGMLFLFYLLRSLFDVWAGPVTWMAAACFALLTTGSLAAGICGSSLFFLTQRFQSYVRVLGDRSFCDLRELADALGKDLRYIRKDVRRMIEKKWFLEGHMDRQQTCLIVTDATYQQYLQAENQRLIRQKQEEQQKEQKAGMPAQVQEVLEVGNAYIQRIRKCNEDIPGEEISEKISRTEQLIRQIFARVEEHPETVSDIRKLMEYYLPTTVKLLDAYAQLDAQPVQGEHITSSKKEIEDALDTLNLAFEKLLDSLFRDMAWDVSSDISVLETMLAQEGLTNDNFRRENQ